MKKLARNWLSFARLDLEAADKLRRDPEMTGIAAFHCQQCAEKSLKAIIAQNDLTVPRTHDLITLYAQVSELASSVNLDEEILRQIDEAYIETRYPTDTATEAGPRISIDRAERFGAESRRIYEQARKLVSET
jgi:HEPN domain-containing protein